MNKNYRVPAISEMLPEVDTGDKLTGSEDPNDRRRYNGTFKLNAIIKLLRGAKQVDVANELGVSQPLLSIWKRRALEAVCREFGVVPSSSGKQGKSLSGAGSHLIGNPSATAVPENLEALVEKLSEKARSLEEKMAKLEEGIPK